MAAMTYNDLVDGLEALSVSGVDRTYQGPPPKLNTADMPSKWVQFPVGEELPISKGVNWPRLRAELVIAYEAVGQNTQPANFSGTVDLMDAMVTALRSLSLGMTVPSWDMRLEQIFVGNNAYWAVVAGVEVEG